MRDQGTRSVDWEVTDRGPRVILHLGGEDIAVTTERAKAIRDDLTAVLREIGVEPFRDVRDA